MKRMKQGVSAAVREARDKRSTEARRHLMEIAGPLDGYDLSDPEDVIEVMGKFGYNGKWASEACGKGMNYFGNKIRKLGIQDTVAALKQDYERQFGKERERNNKIYEKTQKRKHQEELRQKRELDKDKVSRALEDMGEETIYRAIIQAGGIVKDAAEILECKVPLLMKIILASENLQEACELGEKELHLWIRDDMLSAARGKMEPTREQSKWMLNYSKARMGWNETQRVEHSGSVGYNIDDLPEDVPDVDLPQLSVVNGKKEDD